MDITRFLASAPRWSVPLIISSALVGIASGTLMVVIGSGPNGTTFPATVLVLGWSFAGCGVVLIQQPPGRRIGMLFLLTGVAWTLRGLLFLPPGIAQTVATMVHALPVTFLVHAVILSPGGERRDLLGRGTLVLAWLLPFTLAPDYILGDRDPSEPCMTCLSLDPGMFTSPVRIIAHLHVALLAGALLWVVVRRWHRGRGSERFLWSMNGMASIIALHMALETVAPAVLPPNLVQAARLPFNALGVTFLVMLPPVVVAGLLYVWLDHASRERDHLRRDAHARTAAALHAIQRDLHDGAQLRMLKAAIAVRLARTNAAEPAVVRSLDTAVEELREAMEDLRRLAAGNASEVLRLRGLPAALERLATGSPVPVTLYCEPMPDLSPDVGQAIYYVVSEALTNVARHAQAQSVLVTCRVTGGNLVVEISDDGIGNAVPGEGHGMGGMAQRAKLAGGEFELSSPPGGGTTVRVVIPCVSSSPTTLR
ncbi:sensor histidine kinase [Streptosporangium subroseum]|uniref:sensor histidine kinase n=1 Tax=Streptosporangium subroseum TaxID=106412 RepID=UPI000B78A420|nr:ATP-binding protein [Streptosporangium subroseum]